MILMLKSFLGKLKIVFVDTKIQHTVFALPFAFMSAFLAANGFPAPEKLFWIIIAVFGGRNAAMAFNRIMDAQYDQLNPRAQNRALPSGKISVGQYWFFLVASSLLLILAATMLNRLALYLSPLALGIVFFYSLTKRFTSLTHLFLGLALSVAPIGAWVAIREEISFLSIILGGAVIFWLIGFDIIYACQDVEIDRRSQLHSIPVTLGISRALVLARFAHAIMIGFLLILLISPLLGKVYLLSIFVVAGLLVFEHSLVKSTDLSKVNIAFFNVNGIIGVILMTMVIVDCIWV